MKQREVVFYSEGDKLIGTIYLPDDYKEGEKRPTVIANSGWTGLNIVYPAMFARDLTKRGYVCMGFDYRGFKPSEGLTKYTTLEREVEDVCAAINFLKAQPEVDRNKIGLIGWGVGGAVCIEAARREKETVKVVATLNSFVDGDRWMRMGMGNDKYHRSLELLEQDKITRATTGDIVLRHPYIVYPNIEESGDFYIDSTLKKLNGGVGGKADEDAGESFPTPMSTAIGDSFFRFNVEYALSKLECGVFVGHGKYNELHDKIEAEEAYRLANGPKELYFVEGKHNEWMFDNDPKLVGLMDALSAFFAKFI
ncbi:alpha/beta hydrolase [Fusobacterium sp. FSA-380-WT-3A]|uniref:alpha/beta hydrolase n=1 Tax=Fusobacterium sp. FSA-380-WT-3A TaxID=2725304 RepID=UPI001476EC5B|nr:alpha/beta hydrolase [Fusobacterium sp. FSA-380-WT-3A]NME36576.1 alpha/beta hydrolase [Fusobacterium sp. FSA-380-WT-3A]